MKTDNTPWARWARKTCTVILWSLGIGSVLAFGLAFWSLLGDEASVHQFYSQSGRLILSGKPLDLSRVTDVGQIRLLEVTFMAGILLGVGAVFLILTRLRRLLDEVLSGRPFSPQAVPDLKLIGAALLCCSAAMPLFIDLVEAVAGAVVPGFTGTLTLIPDLTFLLCGFLVRTLAVIFEHGLGLQDDADLTV